MSGDVQVRICEGLKVRFLWATRRLVHCRSEKEAQQFLVSLKARFEMCNLEIHPEKTKIVYCKDGKRKRSYPTTKFTFLGYDFRQRSTLNKETGEVFQSFNPAVSKTAEKSMRAHIRTLGIRNRTGLSLKEIAVILNPILRGWIEYYGSYNRSALGSVMVYVNRTLTAWAMRKYKRLQGHKTRAILFILKIQKEDEQLFSHWKQGLGIGFA